MALSYEDIIKMGKIDAPAPPVEEAGMLSRIGQGLTSNLDIPASIAGGIAGATYGAAAGPVGAVFGGIAGGAAGAFGGSLASSVIDDGRITRGELTEARNAAATSALFDVATLGAGKVIKGAAKVTGLDSALSAGINSVKQSLGFASRPSLSSQIPQLSRMEELDAPAATKLAQDAFTAVSKTATLTAAQTGSSSFLRNLGEGIARMGLISGRRFDKIDAANIAAVKKAADDTIGLMFGGNRLNDFQVGEAIAGTLQTAKQAATKAYGDALDDIKTKYGSEKVSLGDVRAAINKFEKEAITDTGSSLTDETLKVIQDVKDMVLTGKKVTRVKRSDLTGILNLSKTISTLIADAGVVGKNPSLRRQLMELKEAISPSITNTVAKIDPKAAKAWKAMDSEYSTAVNGIDLTDVAKLSSLVTSAKSPVEVGQSLGKHFLNSDIADAKTFMKGIQTSYNTIIKNAPAKQRKGLLKEKEEVINSVRRGYMADKLEALNSITRVTDLNKIADNLMQKESMAQAREILGEAFPDYKRLAVMMKKASFQPESGILSLAFKSREVTGISQLAALGTLNVGAAGAGMLAGAPALLSAVAVLTLPSVIGRIATNKTVVQKLVSLDEASKGVDINKLLEWSDLASLAGSKIAQAEFKSYEKRVEQMEKEAKAFLDSIGKEGLEDVANLILM